MEIQIGQHTTLLSVAFHIAKAQEDIRESGSDRKRIAEYGRHNGFDKQILIRVTNVKRIQCQIPV